MNYRESRQYITDISKYGSVLGLDTITELLKRLGNPQNELKGVHFAGTNGKGSTITYTESIIMQAGYKVGKYTSPSVFDYMEIFQINGKNISEEEYAEHMTSIKKVAEEMVKEGMSHPTPFEVETALAFMCFQKNECDIVLLETGMGGETDATNVMKKVLCSVIVSISLDHTQFLGNTITEIAKVKAGIIKEECPVVLSKQREEVIQTVKKVAEEKRSELRLTGTPYNIYMDEEGCLYFSYKSQRNELYNFSYKKLESAPKDKEIIFENLRTEMIGAYQPYNAVTAIETVLVLDELGYELKNYIKDGIEKAKIPGRFEAVSKEPYFVIDGAHNPDAALRLKETLQMYFTNKRIAIIMGVLADKNYDEVAKAVTPVGACVVTVTPPNARGLDAEMLKKTVERYNSHVIASKSIAEAVKICKEKVAGDEADMILAFGSLSYLGEIKKALDK